MGCERGDWRKSFNQSEREREIRGGEEEKPLPPFSVDVRGSEIRKERN